MGVKWLNNASSLGMIDPTMHTRKQKLLTREQIWVVGSLAQLSQQGLQSLPLARFACVQVQVQVRK